MTALKRWRPLLIAAALLAVLAAAAAGLRLAFWPAPSRFVEFAMSERLDIPTAIAVAGDGTVWFTMDATAGLGRVRGGRLERLPTAKANVEPVGLGVDADGNAWYTDNGARGISRMTPAGEVSSFVLDTPIVRLGRLAVASDGAVWFAEATGYSITRLKDGQINRHVFDSPRGEPYGVAIAADGTVWATLKSGDQLLAITPGGAMQVFDVPRESAVPSDIAVGRDGRVWFIESRDNRIGCFKDGKFQEFEVSGDNPMLSGLVAAPDGSVWFGMLRAGSLGRLRDGHVDTFRLPRERARPYTLALDAHANIWYADIAGYVGMLTAGASHSPTW